MLITRAKAQNSLTPAVVAAYASVAITDDAGLPILPAPHHWLWLTLLCDKNIDKLLLIAPPESGKTSWALNAYIATYVGFYPEANVIIASVSDGVAEARSLGIRNQVESDTWKACFPNVLPAKGMKWEQNNWSVAPNGTPMRGRIHSTLRSYGTGSAITGARADLLFGDDILDENNTHTQAQRDNVRSWLHSSFLTRLKARKGRVVLIGTSWNAGDVYNEIRKDPELGKGWVICHLPFISDAEDGFYANLQYPDDFQYRMLGRRTGMVQ